MRNLRIFYQNNARFSVFMRKLRTPNIITVRSLLVLQNKHYFTSFKGDCRYYILIAIILIPTYPVLWVMILELVL